MREDDKRMEIETKRNYTVSKGNALVQKSRYELSLVEQRTIAYICSLIKPVQPEERAKSSWQLEYEFNILDYCRVCGIDYQNGRMYDETKAVLQKLRDKSMWLEMPDGSEALVGWLAKVRTNKRSGIVKIKIDEDLVPYLFDLQKKFTRYQLVEILGIRSAYSVRLFELFKSYEFQHSKTFELGELKRLLMVENVKAYERYPDFRRRVLEPAVKEINELTYTHVEYETITKGRKVVKILFNISNKTEIKDRMETWKAQDAVLGSHG